MNRHRVFQAHADARRKGFTIPEVMIASSIFLIVMALTLGIFTWVSIRVSWVQHVVWSYTEARRASRDLVDYIRNASAITQVDTNQCLWIELRMPNNSTTRFVVVNPPGDVPRDSYMYMSNSITGNSMIVARGLTGLMTSDGFSRPIFFVQPNMRTIRLGFRVTEPVPAGREAVNDSRITAIIDTSVTLRNSSPTETP